MPKKPCPHQFCFITRKSRTKEGSPTYEEFSAAKEREAAKKRAAEKRSYFDWITGGTEAITWHPDADHILYALEHCEEVSVFQCGLCGEKREHR